MKPGQIKSIRRRLGITQAVLAERLGVSLIAVKKWEGGGRITRRTEIQLRQIERPMTCTYASEHAAKMAHSRASYRKRAPHGG